MQLCALLERAYDLNPDLYASMFLEYLNGFSALWERPLNVTYGAKHAAKWAKIAPFATFCHVDWGVMVQGMRDALEAHERVDVVNFKAGPPAAQKTLDAVHQRLGWQLDPRFLSFFEAFDGLHVRWECVSGEEGAPCGLLWIPSLSDLIEPDHDFQSYFSYGTYQCRWLGGWDRHELDMCMRSIDGYDCLGDYPIYIPGLLLHPRYPNPLVAMTSDSAASLGDGRTLRVYDYLRVVIATLGSFEARYAPRGTSWESTDAGRALMNKVFIPEIQWEVPAPQEVLGLVFGEVEGGARERSQARYTHFTQGIGLDASETPHAWDHLPLPQDPRCVVLEPNAGTVVIEGDDPRVVDVLNTLGVDPEVQPQRFRLPDRACIHYVMDASMAPIQELSQLNALTGQVVKVEFEAREVVGCVALVGKEALVLLEYDPTSGALSTTRIELGSIVRVGPARLLRLPQRLDEPAGAGQARMSLTPV